MMPLLDHFQPPLSQRRHWHSFHHAWATDLASALNRHLPEGYFAEANVRYGIEIDATALDETTSPANAGGWQPSPPTDSITFVPSDATVEIAVFSDEGGLTLSGAIELVSPVNKDRPAARAAFTAKCEALLRAGLGLVIVDVVTQRSANLHEELMSRVDADVGRPGLSLSAAAYRVVERDGQSMLDRWIEPLELGEPLPTVPLWLRGGLWVPVELAETYERTCAEQRLMTGR